MDLNFERKSLGETTYLVLHINNTLVIDTFAIDMMAYNHITNIVPVQVVQKDEERQIQFNITGLTELNTKMNTARPKKEVLAILGSMLNALEETEAYMLDAEHLLLSWQYVYLDDKDNCMFLYIPVSWNSGVSQIAFLSEVISKIRPDEQERDPYIYDILNAFGRGAVRKLSDFRELLKKSADVSSEKQVEEHEVQYQKEQKKEPDIFPRQADAGNRVPVAGKQEEKKAIEKKAFVSASIPVLHIPGKEPEKKAASREPEGRKKEAKKVKEEKDHKKGFFKKKKEERKHTVDLGKEKRNEIVIPGSANERPGPFGGVQNVLPNSAGAEKDEMYEKYEATVIMQEPMKAEEAEGTVLLQGSSGQRTARLVQKRDGFIYWIQGARTTVGSGTASDIHIENRAVSRQHATVVCINGQYYIEDNQSKNGSYIEGRRLQPGVKSAVYNGMSVKFANEEFEFLDF